MPDSYEVVGDDLCVTHDRVTTRLTLAIPWDRMEVWLSIPDGVPTGVYRRILDEVMPAEVRDYVSAIEDIDGIRALEVQSQWVFALGDRLGKALRRMRSGGATPQPSPLTSGSDSESEATGSEPSAGQT